MKAPLARVRVLSHSADENRPRLIPLAALACGV